MKRQNGNVATGWNECDYVDLLLSKITCSACGLEVQELDQRGSRTCIWNHNPSALQLSFNRTKLKSVYCVCFFSCREALRVSTLLFFTRLYFNSNKTRLIRSAQLNSTQHFFTLFYCTLLFCLLYCSLYCSTQILV